MKKSISIILLLLPFCLFNTTSAQNPEQLINSLKDQRPIIFLRNSKETGGQRFSFDIICRQPARFYVVFGNNSVKEDSVDPDEDAVLQFAHRATTSSSKVKLVEVQPEDNLYCYRFQGLSDDNTARVYGDGSKVIAFVNNYGIRLPSEGTDSISLLKLPNLEELHINKSSLKEIDLSANTRLRRINLMGNDLARVILPEKMDFLEELDLSNNRLKKLNFPHAPELQLLDLSDNELWGKMSLERYTKLKDVYLGSNELTGIRVEGNDRLEHLEVGENYLKKDNIEDLKKMSTKASDITYYDDVKKRKYPSTMARFKTLYPNAHIGAALEAGYTLMYGNGAHQGYLGTLVSLFTDKNSYDNDNLINMFSVGGGVYWGNFNGGKTRVIPTFVLGYSPINKYFSTRLAVSTHFIRPSTGFNFANIFHLHVGYSIGYKKVEEENIKGLTLNVIVNLGINHYTRFKGS